MGRHLQSSVKRACERSESETSLTDAAEIIIGETNLWRNIKVKLLADAEEIGISETSLRGK